MEEILQPGITKVIYIFLVNDKAELHKQRKIIFFLVIISTIAYLGERVWHGAYLPQYLTSFFWPLQVIIYICSSKRALIQRYCVTWLNKECKGGHSLFQIFLHYISHIITQSVVLYPRSLRNHCSILFICETVRSNVVSMD